MRPEEPGGRHRSKWGFPVWTRYGLQLPAALVLSVPDGRSSTSTRSRRKRMENMVIPLHEPNVAP